MSFAQQRLWFLDQYSDNKSVYNIACALDFEGDLDLNKLQDCIRLLVNNQEILRTTFGLENEVPVQRIHAQMPVKLETYEFTTDEDIEERIRSLISDFSSLPFNLSEGPLIRFKLLKRGADISTLVIVMHHIISDGWSLGILTKELTNVYINGKEALSVLPIQYVDYTVWQREMLEGERRRKLLEYWRNQLKDSPVKVNLPLDFERPVIQKHQGATLKRRLNKPLSDLVEQRCRSLGVTPFMMLMSVYAVFIERYSGEDDIVIGTPIANRNRKELEALIGLFVNTLALRVKVMPELSFSELLSRVKEMTLGAYQHQDLPFEEIIDALQPERDTSYSPVFQVFFAYQNTPQEVVKAPGLLVKPLVVETNTSKFDLSLYIHEVDGKTELRWEYSVAIFKQETVTRFAENFEIILESALKNPDKLVKNLEGLTESEKKRLTHEFNNTFLELLPGKTIIHLFEEQVARTPEAIALRFEESVLSYAELNKRANCLGAYLRDIYGIKPGDFVGILLPRGSATVISMMAILKSGAAYVPVDNAYPEDRIKYILNDSNCKVIINPSELDKFYSEQNCYSGQNLSHVNRESDLAYLIYTSGSTGRPKGVMIEHGNVYSFIGWCMQEFKTSDFDVVLGVTSICFDLSIFEIFYTLCSGKTLKLLESALQIPKYLNKTEKILLNTVPSVVAALIAEECDWSPVTVLNMAGEPIPRKLIQALNLADMEVRNLYGPSEDTTYSTIYRIKTDAPVLIGHPIANTFVYVLNDDMRVQPIGVVGEICISGSGLARGYLNNETLTNEKFVSNPFKPGERIYRTGDLGRWLPNGEIDFIGRRDTQVKINGYRIELGEVESVFLSHPEIESVIVTVREDRFGEKVLVAYFSGKNLLHEEGVRSHLRNYLPHYMVPPYLMQLSKLPLNNNGKLDKSALPSIREARSLDGTEFTPPKNQTESKLVEIWSEVLNLDPEKIGVKDNFFRLGGNSLKTIKIISRISNEFGVTINLQSVFKEPTIECLGETIDFFVNESYREVNREGLTEIAL